MAQYRTVGGGTVSTFTFTPDPKGPRYTQKLTSGWKCDACHVGDKGYVATAAQRKANEHAGTCRRIPNT